MLEQTTTCVENDDVDDESRSSFELALYKPFHESLFKVNLMPKKMKQGFCRIYIFIKKLLENIFAMMIIS